MTIYVDDKMAQKMVISYAQQLGFVLQEDGTLTYTVGEEIPVDVQNLVDYVNNCHVILRPTDFVTISFEK